MKLQALNIKKLRKKSIAAIRDILKAYNLNYSIADDKDKLLSKVEEIQHYSRKIKVYSRYEMSM
ncbi:hypothetical protein AF332_11535 [Sporosarcina globispora]|uniref:Uncharacterized protein n=1 Tax=Sporosarcina globispora TaxID=1459 RepID=A0A0M0GBU9_SPOGL|nr:hypothetical protein [Sporosarcina globispora]KON87395.1 hypothetical protein AF332_11535 [Sporosarcina globispora]